MKPLWALVCALACVSCELSEIVTTESEALVIAEVYLRTDQQVQTAWLHRTRHSAPVEEVMDAEIEVRNAAGAVMRYALAPDSVCIIVPPGAHGRSLGSCYVADGLQRFDIQPGARYTLSIMLPGAGELTGVTVVPEDFELLQPTNAVCALPPATRFDVGWTTSAGAWVYAAETNLRGLRAILQQQGIEINEDPLRLFGLAVSNTDTIISFPNEFGLFDRFDSDLTEALVAIQNGLPNGVVADVAIGAADRNYVNWERGGNFNPSGPVRIGSIRGPGAGVFGSVVVKSFQIRVGSSEHPSCL